MGTIEIAIDTAKNLTTIKASGQLTADDFRECIERYYEGEVTPLILWEITNANLSLITTDGVIGIARLTKGKIKKREGGKTAVVLDDRFDFGIARMLEAYFEIEDLPVTFQAFRNIDDARQWLGV